jgi:hypothetical protein
LDRQLGQRITAYLGVNVHERVLLGKKKKREAPQPGRAGAALFCGSSGHTHDEVTYRGVSFSRIEG